LCGGLGYWPDETTHNLGRYAQFTVSPKAGLALHVTSVTLFVGGSGGSSDVKASLFYSADGFATSTPLEVAIAVPNSSLEQQTYTVDVQVAESKSCALRVCPWLQGGKASGKYFTIQNVVISGMTYYVRAYATDGAGISYGSQKSFKTVSWAGCGGRTPGPSCFADEKSTAGQEERHQAGWYALVRVAPLLPSAGVQVRPAERAGIDPDQPAPAIRFRDLDGQGPLVRFDGPLRPGGDVIWKSRQARPEA
jgi:hypothetical protein